MQVIKNKNKNSDWTLQRVALLSYNEVERITPRTLDVVAAFETPVGKRPAYDREIGNRPELTDPAVELPAASLTLPLSTFISRGGKATALPVGRLDDPRLHVDVESALNLLRLTDADTGEVVVPRPDELTVAPTFDVAAYGGFQDVESAPNEPTDVVVDVVVDLYHEQAAESRPTGFEIDHINFQDAVRGLFVLVSTAPSVYDKSLIHTLDSTYQNMRPVAWPLNGFIDAFHHADTCLDDGIYFRTCTLGQLTGHENVGSVNFTLIDHCPVHVGCDGDDLSVWLVGRVRTVFNVGGSTVVRRHAQ